MIRSIGDLLTIWKNLLKIIYYSSKPLDWCFSSSGMWLSRHPSMALPTIISHWIENNFEGAFLCVGNCKKRQKSHNQETGFGNRGRLKVLNNTIRNAILLLTFACMATSDWYFYNRKIIAKRTYLGILNMGTQI